MKKKTAIARIIWLDSKSGGRKKPPTGPKYSTVIRFRSDAEWPENAWSIVVEFDSLPNKSQEMIATIWFLAFDNPKVPNHFLEPGNQFELYEGNQIVAKGKIIR